MAKIGTVICGKYKIIELAGRGGMSSVYKAIDIHLKKEWAIKEISKKAENETDLVHIKSAIAEANVLKKLDHPAIPRVVDIIDEVDVIYVIMDFIEGETLENLLKKQGIIPENKAVEWIKALCEVLSYLHGQNPPIIYRDMKPGNVIITANGNVKLIDFGIAREYKDSEMTDTVCLGTRGYAAPEQTTGVAQTDQRTDIYNLGATLYQLLTGKIPYELLEKGRSIRRWRSRLPEGLEYIIEKCMQQNPYARYQSCEELLADLENYNNLDKYGRTKEYYEAKTLRKEFFACFGSFLVAVSVLLTAYFLKKEYADVNDYDNSMREVENVVTSEEKIVHYLDAIEARPGELEPYLGLITIMEEDEEYDVVEEQILRRQVEKNLHILQKHEEYAKLAFELGELYWNYYDYGKTENTDNQMTRIKSALRWFEDACQYGKDTDECYASIQDYCALGDYVKSLIQKPYMAADWGNYEVYRKEVWKLMNLVAEEMGEKGSLLKYDMGSVYIFEDSLTKMMGKYLHEGTQISVTEMNREPLQLEKMRVFLEKNGVVRELESEQEYTVIESEKIGEWYTYEYCINGSIFTEEGCYCIELFSMGESGNIYRNNCGMKKIEIAVGIDKTPPNILLVDIVDARLGEGEKCVVTVIAEDNMMMESVEVHIDKEACDVTKDGERFSFEVEKGKAIETITVIARDAAGNETRREMDEVRAVFEYFNDKKK